MDHMPVGEKRSYGNLLVASASPNATNNTWKKAKMNSLGISYPQTATCPGSIFPSMVGKKTSRECFESLGELRNELPKSASDNPSSSKENERGNVMKAPRVIYVGDNGSKMQSITSPGQLRRIHSVPSVLFPTTDAASIDNEATTATVVSDSTQDHINPMETSHEVLTSLEIPTEDNYLQAGHDSNCSGDDICRRPELLIDGFVDGSVENNPCYRRGRRVLTQCFIPGEGSDAAPIFSVPADALRAAREIGPRSLIYNAYNPANAARQIPPFPTPSNGLLLLKNVPEHPLPDLDEEVGGGNELPFSESSVASDGTMDMDDCSNSAPTSVLTSVCSHHHPTLPVENPGFSWFSRDFDPQAHTPDRTLAAVECRHEEDPENPSPPKYAQSHSRFFHDIA